MWLNAMDERTARKEQSAPAPSLRTALRDAALWAVLAAAGFAGFSDRARPSPVLLLLATLVLAGAVPASRRWPAAAVFAVNGLCAVGLANGSSPGNAYAVALAVMTYLMGVRGGSRLNPLLVLATCLAVDLAICAGLRVGPVWWFYTVTMLPLALLVPWLIGRYQQARRSLVRGGWQLARSLEEQQRFTAEQARLRERTRIASDMHDSLGHVLSLIALRAGALELSPTLSDQDREDMVELREAVSEAVEALRETVTVLRDNGESGPAGTAVESVEELLERAGASGMAVELERSGESPALSALVGRAVYRVVQETLTNATKHAPGSAVRVRISHARGSTEVRVTNSAPPAGPLPGIVPGNRGLDGLRERVTALGGVLDARPFEGGFRVTARMPDRVGATPVASVTPQEVDPPRAESDRRLGAARRTASLRFAAAFAVPAAVALSVLPAAAYLAYQLSSSVLRPTDFSAIRTGQQRAEFAVLLPGQEYPYPPERVRSASREPGTSCAFYRSNGNLLDQVDIYRLCYSGDRLVSKDVLPGGPSAS
ncbi:sensor histidine kinase [Streptomyces sp. NPDC056402]|uniref:sensor histidine kinase n=1 Tax=Streptomyces sp. NPDC056402 TaxID=3345810 RepID=UPI0035D77479